MSGDAVHIRPALKHEARTIAKLFLISSEGLAAYVWQRLAGPDELLLAVGAKRYGRDDIPCSYRNCLVAERAGRIVGMAHSVPLGPHYPDCFIPELPGDPVLEPYRHLCSPGSLFVSGLAVFPAARRQGIGGRLLQALRERAREHELSRLSLICFEPNAAACRLYRGQGFHEQGRRALVPHPLLHYASGDALLMVAPVAAVQSTVDPRPFASAMPAIPGQHHCGQPLEHCRCA